jgi:hypothetical protein
VREAFAHGVDIESEELRMVHKFARLILVGALVIAFGCSDGGSPTKPPQGPPMVTLAASKDNTLYEDVAGAWSNGAGSYMFAGVTTDPSNGGNSGDPAEIRRALVAFDIANSGIPAGSTVDSVFLQLSVTRVKPASTNITLHRVSADWGEGTSLPSNPNEGGGTASTTGDATWIHRFFNTQLWTNPGGDYIATVSATVAVTSLARYTWGSTTGMVVDVQEWLDNSATNFGWILIGDETTDGTAVRFDTRTNVAQPNRPQLTIYYTAP